MCTENIDRAQTFSAQCIISKAVCCGCYALTKRTGCGRSCYRQRTPCKKLVAARANAYERGYMAAVALVDASIDQRQATRRDAKNRSKTRKSAVAAQMRDDEFQNRTPDPFPDEGSSR